MPVLWRVLAATWAKNCLVLGRAEINEATKACAALAVAMNARSPYMTAYVNPWVRTASQRKRRRMVHRLQCLVGEVALWRSLRVLLPVPLVHGTAGTIVES